MKQMNLISYHFKKEEFMKKHILATILILSFGGSSAYSENAQIDTLTNEPTTTANTNNITNITPEQDSIITSSIKKQILKSKILSKLNIDVKSNRGVVILSGNVDSDSQASMLVELAQSIIGVQNVDTDNLTVKNSTQPFTDTLITAKIKGLFIREKVFGDKDISAINISVETKDGVVYLTGIIENQTQLKNAIKLAETVAGVKKVEYRLAKVEPHTKNGNGNNNHNNGNGNHNNDY
jgi:hyperosmotically inducible protein